MWTQAAYEETQLENHVVAGRWRRYTPRANLVVVGKHETREVSLGNLAEQIRYSVTSRAKDVVRPQDHLAVASEMLL